MNPFRGSCAVGVRELGWPSNPLFFFIKGEERKNFTSLLWQEIK
jgi:hypothetical protein